MLVAQVEKGEAKVEIAYRRGVSPEGNLQAQKLMDQVFESAPADWRGMGVIPGSGLTIRKEYLQFDVEAALAIEPGETIEPKGCLCGDILRGVKTPADCLLFGKVCTPESPVGPCMVSAEGTCAAYYLYGGEKTEK
jgi:hydrogenase expression/formation protein HypD